MTDASQPDREARLEAALAEYLQAAEAGQAPDREEFIARHPDLADELRSFFADRDHFEQVAGRPVPAAPAGDATSPPEPPAAADPSLGTIRYFGDYELLEEIARGGMGVVFRARQVSLNRQVAVKMILAGQDVDRFRREAQTAANLDHPGIVPIHEVGEHEGQHYFSMKLIEGGDLGRQRDRFRNDFQAIARLLADVARAVQYAHERGLLHRDLKPANILLDPQGKPHVTDFGLARRVEDPAGRTQSGAILGTPAYMAPEQAAGRNREMTPAADVYALGAILYELLTRRPPFQAEAHLDVLLKVMSEEPSSPRRLNPAVPCDLETICLKCLRKEPGQRYPSAAAFAADLDRWLDCKPITARPVGSLERLGRWVRRHPEQAILRTAAAAAVLLAVGFAVFWGVDRFRAMEAERERQAAEARRTLHEQQLREAREAKDRGLRLLAQGDAESGALWLVRALEKAPADADELLQAIRPPLNALIHRWQARLILPDHPLGEVSWTGDGRWLTTAGREKIVYLMDSATMKPVGEPIQKPRTIWATRFRQGSSELLSGQMKLSAPFFAIDNQADRHQGSVRAAALSPDGKLLLTGSEDRTARLWDMATGKPVGAPMAHLRPVSTVDFSPDGKTILTGDTNLVGGELVLHLWNEETGKPVGGPLPATFQGKFHPNGKAILVTHTDDHRAQFLDLQTGKFFGPRFGAEYVRDASLSPDGRIVLTMGLTSTGGKPIIRLWNAEDGKPLGNPREHYHGTINPAGDRLAVMSGDLKSLEVRSVAEDQLLWKPELRKEEQGQSIGEIVFSPDGKLLLARSWNTLFLWDATTGRPQAPARTFPGGIEKATFSPDGKAVLVETGENDLQLWDAGTGQPLDGEEHRPPLVQVTGDGKRALRLVDEKTVQLHDTGTNQPVGKAIPCRWHDGVVLSPNGSTVLTDVWTEDLVVRLWELSSGKLLASEPRSRWSGAAYSRDSRLLALVGKDDLIVLDTTTGRTLLRNPRPHDPENVALLLTPDSHYLLVQYGETAQFWEVATGKPLGKPIPQPWGLDFSPDGRMFLTYSREDKRHVVRSIPTGERLWTLSEGSGTEGGALVLPPGYRHPWGFSPDSRRAVSGGVDSDREEVTLPRRSLLSTLVFLQGPTPPQPSALRGKAEVWDMATGKRVGKPLRHDKPVYAVTFSPDGKWVLTGSEDKTARLWEADTGNLLATFEHPDWVMTVAFSPDGKRILTGTQGGQRRLWDIAAIAETPPLEHGAEWVQLWVQVRTHKELDDHGNVRELDPQTVFDRQQRLQQLGGPVP